MKYVFAKWKKGNSQFIIAEMQKNYVLQLTWEAEFISDETGYFMRFPSKVLYVWPGCLLAAYSQI